MIDDSYLIKRCIEKDRKCQKLLYEKYASLMLGVCIRYADNREGAEDILQEGFLKVFLSIGQYSGKGTLPGWMKSIMINTAINHFHRNKKYRDNKGLDQVEDGLLKDQVTTFGT
jgi:RNA polymerase sigma-70 factor, ECF subfamily